MDDAATVRARREKIEELRATVAGGRQASPHYTEDELARQAHDLAKGQKSIMAEMRKASELLNRTNDKILAVTETMSGDENAPEFGVLQRAIRTLKQTQFDSLLFLILGRSSSASLDSVRHISSVHKAALFNIENQRLKTLLETMKTALEAQKAEAEAQATEFQNLEAEVNALVEEKASVVKQLIGERDNLRTALTSQTQTISQHETMIKSLVEKIAMLEKELGQNIKLLSQRETAIKSSDEKIAMMENELRRNIELLSQRDLTVETLQRQVQDVKDTMLKEQQTSTALVNEKDAEIDSLRRRLEDQQSLVTQMRGEAQAAKQSSDAEISKLRERYNSLQADHIPAMDRLQGERSGLAESLRDAQSNFDFQESVLWDVTSKSEDQIRELSAQLQDALLNLTNMDSELEDAQESCQTKDDRIGNLTQQLDSIQGEKLAADNANTALESERSKLRMDLDSAMTDLDNKRIETSQLRVQIDNAQTQVGNQHQNLLAKDDALQQLKRQELGIAEFFCSQTDLKDQDPALWVPLVSAISDAKWITGTVFPSSDERPWAMLQVWGKDDPAPLSAVSSALFDVLLQTYARVTDGDFSQQAQYLLRRLTEILAIVEVLPMAVVLELLDRAVEMLEIDSENFSGHFDKQLFAFGLAQLVFLVQLRWEGSVNVDVIVPRLDSLVQKFHSSLSELYGMLVTDGATFPQRCHDTRLPDGSIADVESTLIYFPGSGLALAKLSGAPDYVCLIDINQRTVRLIHSSRGSWASLEAYGLRSPQGDDDLRFVTASYEEYNWFFRELGASFASREE
ncbi:hypothetical protein SUNI508_07577 [Seiridium unicorne]|uniref:Uncharacterized protein n=1 Tax=Seiridium unicorne TaxID=138068 RepID=A0ABR2UWV0_9PEZI